MKLLDAKVVKSSKDGSIHEQEERIRKLNGEETSSAKRLNDALLLERKEIEASRERLRDFEVLQSNLAQSLSKEVNELEKRKREALLPIVEREEAVMNAEEAVQERRTSVEELTNSLETKIIAMRAARADYESKLNQLDIREASLVSREAKIADEKSDLERNSNAWQSRLRDERDRLRKHFETEDEKLKIKQQHGRA